MWGYPDIWMLLDVTIDSNVDDYRHVIAKTVNSRMLPYKKTNKKEDFVLKYSFEVNLKEKTISMIIVLDGCEYDCGVIFHQIPDTIIPVIHATSAHWQWSCEEM